MSTSGKKGREVGIVIDTGESKRLIYAK